MCCETSSVVAAPLGYGEAEWARVLRHQQSTSNLEQKRTSQEPLGTPYFIPITPFFQLKSMQIGIRNIEKETQALDVRRDIFLPASQIRFLGCSSGVATEH